VLSSLTKFFPFFSSTGRYILLVLNKIPETEMMARSVPIGVVKRTPTLEPP
jgi:hypothetical protein